MPASWAQNRRFADARVFWFLEYLRYDNVNVIHIIKINLGFCACVGGAVWDRSEKHKDGTKQCLCRWQLSHQSLWVFSHFPHQGLSRRQCVKMAKLEPFLQGKSSVAQLCFWLCSCTWVSLWAPEERTVWSRSEKLRSFLCSRSTCYWRASVPHLRMCRTLSSSTTAPESQNTIACILALMSFFFFFFSAFQVGLLSAELPVLHHSAATVRGHQTLFQAGDTSTFAQSQGICSFFSLSEGIHSNYRLTCLCVLIFQAIKQMYVLVLGLDVLGNPFGLIRGLSEGFEALFYEPYQVEKLTIIVLEQQK